LRLATLPRSADIKPTAFAPPRDWSSAGIDSSARTQGPVPLGSVALAALLAHEALLHSAASLQGLNPFAGWGHRPRISPVQRRPGSPGLSLLGAFPFPALGLFRQTRAALSAHASRLAGRPGASRHQATVSAACLSSRALQERHPYWVLLPVLQSFKELGNWLTSSEVAGPFKVPVLVPNG
jgi:hypothetical protein